MSTETERVRQIWEKMAPRYDKDIAFAERILFAGGREWVCAQAAGRVLEVAVGTGRNLPFYPPHLRLTGIELSPAMLEIGRRRGAELGIEVDLRAGDAQALDFDDESFDTVVITLALCSIPDDRKTVAEAWRVLRPDGLLLLLEHVRSPLLAVRVLQRIVDFFTVRFEGDHLLREPLEQLQVAGFVVDRLERSKLGIVERLAAHKPSL
ncbi:MAG: class I SAM-dependent methyltransferase [Candidatus Dormibacter sp.]|uniref:class I SAM-dependent methyltransferase n=1 Tax=Candidatus Dormibacter sp. TaxID=2973982 RepID=UPI0026A6F5EB